MPGHRSGAGRVHAAASRAELAARGARAAELSGSRHARAPGAGRDDVSIDEVVRIVSAEPSLSVRLLQLANSAALNPGAQRVTTLRAAIARIGFNLARSATIAFAMSQMRRAEAWRGLRERIPRDLGEQRAARRHQLSRWRGIAERADADQALLAGMLHAVGKLFVLTRVSRFPALLARCRDRTRDRKRLAGARRAGAADALGAASRSPARPPATSTRRRRADEGTATLADVLLAARYLVGVRTPARGAEAAPSWRRRRFARLGLDARRCGRRCCRLRPRKSPRCAPRWRIEALYICRGERLRPPQCARLTFRRRWLNSPVARPITRENGRFAIHELESRRNAGSQGGPRRQSEVARLVEALTVELAAEKIDLPSFPGRRHARAPRAHQRPGRRRARGAHHQRRARAGGAPAAARELRGTESQRPPASPTCARPYRASASTWRAAPPSPSPCRSCAAPRPTRAWASALAELWQQSAHVAAMSHVVAKRFTQVNADTALLAGLLQGVGKLYLLTRAVTFPVGAGRRRHLPAPRRRMARAPARRPSCATGSCPRTSSRRSRPPRTASASTTAPPISPTCSPWPARSPASGPDPLPEQMLFLGMPAARRMKLDAAACGAALAESHDEICSLRQALSS